MTNKEKTAYSRLIKIGWPGGALTLRYVGVVEETEEAKREIQVVMRQFSADCQKMLIRFAGILGSRDVIKRHLDELATLGDPLSVNTYRPDGRVDSVRASLPVEDIVEAVSEDGEFERLYAKAFVVFTYQIWEEVARVSIAKALKVDSPNHVKSDLMGDWRHLRNWLVHQNESSKNDFFEKSKILPHLLGIQSSEPSLTAGMVAVLMQQLNNLRVDVSPKGLDFGLEGTSIDATMIAEIAKSIEPNTGVALLDALMFPSSASIVFNDDPTATIHERNCERSDAQF